MRSFQNTSLASTCRACALRHAAFCCSKSLDRHQRMRRSMRWDSRVRCTGRLTGSTGIDGSGSSLFMQVPSGSVPKAMRGEEAAHVADRCFEILHEALSAIERDHLLTILRVFRLDHAHLTRRDTVVT